MSYDKGVARSLRLIQEAVCLFVVWVVEVYDNEGIIAHVKGKSCLADVFAQLFGQAGRHEGMIGFEGIDASDIVVAHYGNERKSSQLLLEPIHNVGKHLFVYLAIATVSLNEVAHLQYHASVLVNQPCCLVEEAWTTVFPHCSITGKLGALNLVEPFIRLVIMGMINGRRVGIEVCVAQDNHGV